MDPHRTGFGKIPKPGVVRLPLFCRIREGLLGVDPFQGTRGTNQVPVRQNLEVLHGAGSQHKEADHRRLGFVNPAPTKAPSQFESIDRFVGYFLQPQASQVNPKSYAQVVCSSSGLDSGNIMSRREGFGLGRQGRGAGRTNARNNVWQRIDGRDQRGQDHGRGNNGDFEQDGRHSQFEDRSDLANRRGGMNMSTGESFGQGMHRGDCETDPPS